MTEGPSRPALLKEIERLKDELAAARAPVERVVEVERLIEVPVYVERVIYADNPAHLETIRALQAQIAGDK